MAAAPALEVAPVSLYSAYLIRRKHPLEEGVLIGGEHVESLAFHEPCQVVVGLSFARIVDVLGQCGYECPSLLWGSIRVVIAIEAVVVAVFVGEFPEHPSECVVLLVVEAMPSSSRHT